MSEQSRLAAGEKAPEFTLPDSTGKQVSLSDCTKQACDFRDNLAELNDAGFDVLGISPDSPAKLAKFVEAEGLTFPLLSDADRTVMKEWGAFGEKQNYGRTIMGVIRSTFIVDGDGNIAKAAYNVRATGHVAKLRKDLGV
jgi:peroxiredoxin Q/BCP